MRGQCGTRVCDDWLRYARGSDILRHSCTKCGSGEIVRKECEVTELNGPRATGSSKSSGRGAPLYGKRGERDGSVREALRAPSVNWVIRLC